MKLICKHSQMSILAVTIGRECSRQSVQELGKVPRRRSVHNPDYDGDKFDYRVS